MRRRPGLRSSIIVIPAGLALLWGAAIFALPVAAQTAAGLPQPAPAAQSSADGPLNDPLLQETDEDNVTPDLFSRTTFKYDHGTFNGGSENDRVRIAGQQAFGRSNRLSLGYELPFVDFRGGPTAQSGHGLGDIKLESNLLLGKGERFAHAARVELTFPSASNNATGLGQNILKVAWGFSTPLASRTVFSGTLAYNKALSARTGQNGLNSFEPEAVLAQEFTRRLAGFLDWDTYEDFNANRFGQTLKGGLTIELSRGGRWNLSPYAQFALNHFTGATNIKSDLGFDLSFRY